LNDSLPKTFISAKLIGEQHAPSIGYQQHAQRGESLFKLKWQDKRGACREEGVQEQVLLLPN
jgi:hypothetical protein